MMHIHSFSLFMFITYCIYSDNRGIRIRYLPDPQQLCSAVVTTITRTKKLVSTSGYLALAYKACSTRNRNRGRHPSSRLRHTVISHRPIRAHITDEGTSKDQLHLESL